MISIPEILNTALQHHQAGRLGDAAAGYLEILSVDPKHSDALHLLGVVAQQQGKFEMSVELMKKAIDENSSIAHYHHNLANTYTQMDRLKEAVECYCSAIRLKTDYYEAYQGLGDAISKSGKLEAAADAYRKAIQLRPSASEAHYNLGRLLALQGKEEEAVQYYRTAIELDDRHVAYFFNLGGTLYKQEKYSEAVDCYRQALKLEAGDAEIHHNLGRALAAKEEFQSAVDSYRQAIALNPAYTDAYSNLGVVLLRQGNFSEAELCCKKAVDLNPDSAEAHYSLGNVFRETNRISEAIACYRKSLALQQAGASTEQDSAGKFVYWQVMNNLALALSLEQEGEVEAAIDCYQEALRRKPENATLHCNLGFTLLMTGKFPEGWAEHEWRQKLPSTPQRDFSCPQWKGEPLNGARILLHAEQGYGDTLQFVRYAPLVAERGGRVVLEVQPRLHRLLSRMPGIEQVIPEGDKISDLSWHCPLMSLPLAFGTCVDTVPASVPYLHVPQKEQEQALQSWPGSGLRVGLAWSGNPKNAIDSSRSMRLNQMSELGSVSGVSFYSLQAGEITNQLAELTDTFKIIDACSKDRDFADSAALIAGLDLVITVDTSIAHLAGALGVPVWVLLSNRADWRWFRNRTDSPWYPHARLFRQHNPGDWLGLIEIVKAELQQLSIEHGMKTTEKAMVDSL